MKVVEISVNKEEFEKFCKENGLDPKHKMSKLRFASKFDKGAKEVLDKLEKGEINLKNIEFMEVEIDEDEDDKASQEDYRIGVRCLLKGIAYLMGEKECWKDKNPLDKLSDKGQASIGFALSIGFAKEFTAITECIFKGTAFTAIIEEVENKKKENKKDDKKA